eukprot:m.52849 g.52849  ORF g.52849 m.52849 type:complete len:300 (-) comp16588_c0_seq2:225-1124(-)
MMVGYPTKMSACGAAPTRLFTSETKVTSGSETRPPPSEDIEAAMWLMAMSQSPSPASVSPMEREHTPASSPRKRSADDMVETAASPSKRLCEDDGHTFPHIPGMETKLTLPNKVDFFIHGSQGQLSVCERKTIVRGGEALPYLLVRLRGQSNTLPHDAHLSVAFDSKQPEEQVDVHIARVRIKAGTLRYDFLPEPTTLNATTENRDSYSASLLASVFSKKCWSGVVVRGPRMFVAFVQRKGSVQCHSLPMFVEISPTSNSPGYRDPVLEYSDDMIDQFFSKKTYNQLGRLHSSSRKLDF